MSKKFMNKETQTVPSLLDFYLLKLGEVKFHLNNTNDYINGRGCSIISLMLKFSELDEILENAEDKLMEIRAMCNDDGSYSLVEKEVK